MESNTHDTGLLAKYGFPRFLGLADLIRTLTQPANALDYNLIRPVLLAIPSFTSPFEFFRCIVDRYYEANEMQVDKDQIKFKVLAVMHCWLEQPYAHADLLTASFEKHLKKFLKQVLGENNPFLSDISQSIKMLLKKLAVEMKQLDLANQLYSLRSAATLAKISIESLPLSSVAADNVRVVDSPMPREEEEQLGSHSGIDRYADIWKGELSNSCHAAESALSDSYSYEDSSREVIQSLLANEQECKSDGATASYSTVRLSGSISNRPWAYDLTACPGGINAVNSTLPHETDNYGNKFVQSLDLNSSHLRGDRGGTDPSFPRSNRFGDDASVVSSRPTSHAGGDLMASEALKLMNESVIRIYSYNKLAELLTIIESELGWASLRHREVVNQAWTKDDLKNLHPDLGGAAHLTKFILATDKRMSWVASEILYYGVFVGPISDSLEYFIKVAHSVFQKNNFNTFFQIISSLGLPCIKQLKTGWSNCSRSKINMYAEMVKVCSPQRNYAAYRKCFDAASGAPRIPCLQIFLKDIKMVDSLHPSLSDDGLIDIYKILHMYKLISATIPAKMVTDMRIDHLAVDHTKFLPSYAYVITILSDKLKNGRSSGTIDKSSSYGSIIGSLVDKTKLEKTTSLRIGSKQYEGKEATGRDSPFIANAVSQNNDGDNSCRIGDFESRPFDIDSPPGLGSYSKLDIREALVDPSFSNIGPSLLVIPSFEDACGACRDSLFEPIRNSVNILAACNPADNTKFVWDQGSRSITLRNNLCDPEEADPTSPRMDHISISGKSSEILASIFSPQTKSSFSINVPLSKAGIGRESEKKITLIATDMELIKLLSKIQSSIADLGNLWNDSKVASFAETGRLLLQLCKAGLI